MSYLPHQVVGLAKWRQGAGDCLDVLSLASNTTGTMVEYHWLAKRLIACPHWHGMHGIHLHAVENSCLLPILTMLVLAALAGFLASSCRKPFPGFRLFPLILSAVLQQCARSGAVRCITHFIAQHYESMNLHNSIDTHCCRMTAVAGLSGSCTHLAADQTVCKIYCNCVPA